MIIRNCVPAYLLITAILLSSSFRLQAQGSTAPTVSKTKKERKAEKKARIDKFIQQEDEGALVFRKQFLFGAKLYSDGWAGYFEQGYLKTVNKTNLYSLELGERKDPKQYKIQPTSGSGFAIGNPVIFGKQNNFYFAKLGIGQSYLIGGKGIRNGVAVSAVYSGGISIGMLKPYFLDVVDPQSHEEKSIRWMGDNSRNDSIFLTPEAIVQGSGVFKGWDELKIKPGLHAKAALRFDYGRYNETIGALEAGIQAEMYFSGMPIMVNNKARKFFPNVFLAIEFGKRK